MWKIEKHFVHPARKEYDAVVAFMEGQPIYYAVTKVQAKRKIGFIHGDYNAMGLSQDFDRPYVKQLDALCTVSEGCKMALEDNFPEFREKFHVVYNILSAQFLRKMAEAPVDFGDRYSGSRVLSIARLSVQKGLDLALPAVASLREKGLEFRWYIIGVGPEEAALQEQARSLGIEQDVCFLGEQANPYPFLRACDVYLQPSRFEGKSIAVDEAMVLCKPILLTDFSTAADQVTSGENGLIVPMTPEGIAEGLEKLLTDGELRQRFHDALGSRGLYKRKRDRKGIFTDRLGINIIVSNGNNERWKGSALLDASGKGYAFKRFTGRVGISEFRQYGVGNLRSHL